MQNEPNFEKAQMNVNKVLIRDYENKSNWTLGENKPNQTQFKPKTNPISKIPKMNVNKIITMNYKNLSRWRDKKTNPIKPNFKANPDFLARSISNKSKVPTDCSLTGRNGFYIMICDRIINKASAEVTGAWWCPWSSKPVWG